MARMVGGFVLCAVVAACSGAPATSPSVAPRSPLPATPAPGVASPAESVDVRPAPMGRLAFLRTSETASTGDERRDAFIVDATGENLVRLTDDAKIESALFWLGDGSRIVIVWEEPNDPYRQFLASILPDGTDREELGAVQMIYGPSPQSPDHRYVAFGGDGDPSSGTGVRLLDLSTGSLIALTDDGAWNPIWSPDGDMLMVMLPGRRLGVIDVASRDQVAVIGSDVDRLLGWTPDGRWVLFNACTSGMSKRECMAAPVLRADAVGSEPEVYTDPLPTSVLGAPSPDGNWVAEVVDGCVFEVVAEAAATLHPLDTWTELVAACPSPDRSVSWSPDSAWVAMSSGSSGSESVIALWSPLGGAPVPITEGPSDGHPAWQPGPR